MNTPATSNKMLKRDQTWDYRQPAIYMITLTLAERRPLLGSLVVPEADGQPCPERAYIERSELGELTVECLVELIRRSPEVRLLQYQLMPDHLHLILHVQQELQQPLGRLMGLLKHRIELLAREGKNSCKSAATGEQRDNDSSASLLTMPTTPGRLTTTGLWAPGFNDNRLRTRGQLQRMIAYIQDNPRRLALKRLHRDLLRVQRGCSIAGRAYDAVGNTQLLRRPMLPVHVGSRWTAEEKRAYKNGCILAARQGAVLVGPFISPDERAVLKVALEEGLAVIYLQENGFPELYKPAGELIDSCVEGRVLLLAPWPYHTRRQAITREQCLLLNRMAEELAD